MCVCGVMAFLCLRRCVSFFYDIVCFVVCLACVPIASVYWFGNCVRLRAWFYLITVL